MNNSRGYGGYFEKDEFFLLAQFLRNATKINDKFFFKINDVEYEKKNILNNLIKYNFIKGSNKDDKFGNKYYEVTYEGFFLLNNRITNVAQNKLYIINIFLPILLLVLMGLHGTLVPIRIFGINTVVFGGLLFTFIGSFIFFYSSKKTTNNIKKLKEKYGLENKL